MKYREKLENYKKGLLSEEEMEEVREEIEKADAISEYLADCLDEEMEFTESLSEEEGDRTELQEGNLNFEKYVKKSIRRAYIKMSVGIGSFLLAVLLFVQFGLSPLMNAMYYNPAEQIKESLDDGQSNIIYNRMDLDYRFLAELTMPCRNNVTVQAFPQGYGDYAITIQPFITYGTGNGQSVAGQIRKGKLELYDPDYMKRIPANYFAAYSLDYNSAENYETQMREEAQRVHIDENGDRYYIHAWYYDSPEASLEEIKRLEENKHYIAYVSFNRDLDFQETLELMDSLTLKGVNARDAWLVFRNCEENTIPFGVTGHNHEVSLLEGPKKYNEQYPYLTLFDGFEKHSYEEYVAMRRNEEIMTQHVLSLNRYLDDQNEFTEMMSMGRASNEMDFHVYYDYIREHGLNYFGMVCTATKADMLKMLKNEDILGIIPKDWQQ